ncbi:unnamed protein product [Sphagnum jensenii]|uniref:Peptidoglycan binding-like domain-containing protein n=1 Tax=Sphagnum jensenii TaxID=128206 RepID=A0ABP1BJ26_9BRYO
MTKVVGVGLEWAKVVVCMKSFDVKVISIGENAWRNPWEQVEQTGCSKDFILLNCNLANMNKNKFHISKLTAKESSKKFGIGVHVQGTLKHGEVNTYVEDKGKYVAFNPLIWDLMQYMIDSYCKQCVGSTSNASGRNASQNQERSKGKEKVNMNSQFLPESSNKRDENEEDDKDGPPLSNIGSNVKINAKKKKILIVTVCPGCGGDFYQGNTRHVVEPNNIINTATIDPTLVFRFEIGDTRKLTITSKTQCNLGKSAPEDYDGKYLGYYQDKIKISLSCEEANGARLSSPGPIVERLEKRKSGIINMSTHTKSDAKETNAQGNVQLQVSVPPVNLQFNGQGSRNCTTTIGDSNSNTNSYDQFSEQVDEFLLQIKGISESSYDYKFEFAHNVLDYAEQVERRNSSSSIVRAIAEPVIRKPAPPTIEECKAAVVAGNPPPAPPVSGKPKAPEGTPVITPMSKGHGQQSHGKNEVRDDAGSGERTDACQVLGMEEGQQQRFMGRQVAARGKLQGVEVQGLKIRDNELYRNLMMTECGGARSLNYVNQELGYFGPETMEALQQFQMVQGVPSTVIASEDKVRMIVQKEGKLFDVNYPTSFTNRLGHYDGLNIVGHMWKCMHHFIVANVLKPELL